MSFFDPLPERPDEAEHVEHRPPVWADAPATVVAGNVGLDVRLAQTADAAAWLDGLAATPEGLRFSLVVVLRAAPRDAHGHEPLFGHPETEGGVRFGVGFADGRKAAGLTRHPEQEPTGDAATEIMLSSRGGQGNGHSWRRSHWLWPLPPEGPLTFAFRWTDQDIDETLVIVDSAPIRAAAARAVELWPDPRPDRPADPDARGGWSAYR